MSRGLVTRRDHADALRLRLLACLEEVDSWFRAFSNGDAPLKDLIVANKFIDASQSLRKTIGSIKEAIGLMSEDKPS